MNTRKAATRFLPLAGKENINMADFRFRREVDESFALLGYYASSTNFLPTFWDKPSVPSSGVKNPNK